MKKETKNLIKHIFLFCVLDLFLNFVILFIWRDGGRIPTPEYSFTIICTPFILTILMVRSITGLSRNDAAFLASVLLISNCISQLGINLINPFHRIITPIEYQNGIFRDITSHLLFFIPASIVMAVAFRKKTFSSHESDNSVIDNDFKQFD